MKKPDDKNRPIKGITGLILAGGKSTRFGKNKALVELDGIRLIERVIRVMGSVFQRLIILTNSPHEYSYLNLPMVEDSIKGLGPIGGLYTGLESISDDAGFFVACDMPFLSESLIRHMVEIRDDFDVVLPKIDWKIEALHGLYNKSCLPTIKELIDSHEYQVIRFFPKVHVKYLGENEIREFDPQLKSFFNINKPNELPVRNIVEK
jgi:molybdopterin-guanine dinucleotide biosynthesis protein A